MTRSAFAVELDETKIDAIFGKLNQCRLPGAAVGIALGGRPVYRKGFGLASMELPIILSPSIRMRIYSTTKHFTCLAYMLLCEQGRAHVDDPIGKYFPELHPVAHPVTIRQLMGNVGGLRNPQSLRWELGNGEREIPVGELLDAYRDIDEAEFLPGAGFSYNNSGFELVAAILERITGERFEDVLRARICEPVGMHDTTLRRLNSDFAPNSAAMHTLNAAGQFEKSYLPGAIAGAGGLVSTVDDMLRWLKHMDAPVVGSAATWTMIRTPQVLANGTSTGYGLGLWRTAYRGVETLWHSGGGYGASSQMLKVPDAGLDIAVMVNRSDLSAVELTERIVDVCLPTLDPIMPDTDREMPTGVFGSPTVHLVIELKRATSASSYGRKGQPLAIINGMEYPVGFDTTGALRPSGIMRSTRYVIELVGEPAKPRAVWFSDFGTAHCLEPLELVERADGSRIVGRYFCKALRTEAEILRSGDELRLSFGGPLGHTQCKVESLARGVWASTQVGVFPTRSILRFDDAVRSFGYVSSATHRAPLRFERRS